LYSEGDRELEGGGVTIACPVLAGGRCRPELDFQDVICLYFLTHNPSSLLSACCSLNIRISDLEALSSSFAPLSFMICLILVLEASFRVAACPLHSPSTNGIN